MLTERAPYGDQPLDPRDLGVREFGPPADYAYHPGAEAEFELEYLDWREAKLSHAARRAGAATGAPSAGDTRSGECACCACPRCRVPRELPWLARAG